MVVSIYFGNNNDKRLIHKKSYNAAKTKWHCKICYVSDVINKINTNHHLLTLSYILHFPFPHGSFQPLDLEGLFKILHL